MHEIKYEIYTVDLFDFLLAKFSIAAIWGWEAMNLAKTADSRRIGKTQFQSITIKEMIPFWLPGRVGLEWRESM